MKNEYLKTLWMLRFEKIKEGEHHAASTYQKIREDYEAAFGTDEAVLLLAQLVREEKGHARLAEELIRICKWSHRECEAIRP